LATTAYSFNSTLLQILGLLAYAAACWWVIRPFLRWAVSRFDDGHGAFSPNLIALMLTVIFASSVATQVIGIFAIFGGFMVGVLVHHHPLFVAHWRKSVGSFVQVFFLPIFFTFTGLRTDIWGLNSSETWLWCFAFILGATIGKFGAAFVAAKVSGLGNVEASAIGIMMNIRGLMELIVLNIGFDLGFIPEQVFTMLVIMAVFSTVITAPILRRLLVRNGQTIPNRIDG